jgi:Protein of unknown function (DUF3999)
MRSASCLFALVVALGAPLTGGPSISYFTNVRDIHISQSEQQNYFVVDEEIWARARPDLADLRIYDGETQVQYALSEQHGGTSSHEESARILNLGSVDGRTDFDLDMSNLETGEIGEYDRVRLQLDAKDFVVTASLAGSNQVGAKSATHLPPATLYDFSREDLGSNPVLKLPPSSFRYLHVKLSAGISPAQVKGASVYNLQETKAVWTEVGSCGAPSQVARTTVIICNSPVRVPVDRVRFRIDPKQVNFRRAVVLSDSSDRQYGTGGEITRVRMNRGGATVISEEMDVPIGGPGSGQLKVTLDNGDNLPLSISGIELLSVERRVYFEPQGRSLLKLYYGDDKLGAPVYDYARFFKADPAAARAELGLGAHNEAYRGRPDDRPWSERHKAVLWLAMLLAVIVLAALAIRGLKTNALSS